MKAIVALLVGVCVATTNAVALAFIAGRLTVAVAWIALIAGCLAAMLVPWHVETGERRKLSLIDGCVFVAFGLFAFRAFLWLIFRSGESIRVLSPNNLGDMALHLTYIKYLARGAAFWPENPIFSGVKLHYPIGMDLFNALLEKTGVDTFRGLIWVGLFASLATAIALHRWGGWFTVAGFLFNGGVAGFAIFKTGKFLDYQSEQAWRGMSSVSCLTAWKSLPLSMFVTQRGLLYAIPVGLLLLVSWRTRWFVSREEKPLLSWWIELIFYATLPLFHLHTFLFLSALLGFWTIVCERRPAILRFIACALMPATLLVMLVTGLLQPHANTTSMLHFHPGWMQDGQNAFYFWFGNFGVLPLCVAVLAFLCIYRLDREIRSMAFVFPALLVFLLTCFVSFAPWEWDNMKLMIWSYLAVLPFLRDLVVRPLPFPFRVTLCFLLFFSGFVSLFGGLNRDHKGYEIANREELDAVTGVVRSLPVDATWVSEPTWGHPLLLSGCKVLEGFDGHLFSHGIDYRERDAELRAIFNGRSGWREIKDALGAKYLFWGKRETDDFPESITPWRVENAKVDEGDWGEIYDLSGTGSTTSQ